MKIETEKRGYYQPFWTAIDADSYDGAPDSNANFIGYGDTEAEAIEELQELLKLRVERFDGSGYVRS